MSDLFSYFEGELEDFIVEAIATKDSLLKRVISNVSDSLILDLYDRGVIIDETYRHTLDNNAVRHAIKVHGSPKEILRGQIPITVTDFMLIPEIISNYDSLSIENNRRGQDIIVYSKKMSVGMTIYVEEIRLGRHELAASTIYKKKDDSPTLID